MRTYSKNESLIILGAGSHGHVVKEIAESMGIFREINFLDDRLTYDGVLGRCDEFKDFTEDYNYAIPSFGSNKLRMEWIEKLEKNLFKIPTLIHSTAYVSPSAIVKSGSVVAAKTVINTNSRVEEGCIISIGSIIDHDAVINYGCHVDCGAIIKSYGVTAPLSKINSGEIIESKDLLK